MARYSLAFDFGATSIRAILGAIEDGRFTCKEVMRMSHQRVTENGRSRWEWDKIVAKVAQTIIAHQDEIDSIAVNTWGVDFGITGKDGKLLCNPVSYRDGRHNDGYEFAQQKMSLEDIFMATGNQIMSINSLFQLLVYKKDELEGKDDTMSKIDTLLFLPDLLNYLLTGQKRSELTIASTSQILDLRNKQFSDKILQSFGIDKNIFAPVVYPTEIVGSIQNSLIPELKALNKDIKVIACASHDTASAVLLTEAYTDRDTAFLSCGTWSLIGGLTDEPVISKDAFSRDLTNETGFAGSNMFFKNITGLYILEMLKTQLETKRGSSIPFSEITAYVQNCPVADSVDVDSAVFSQNEFDVKEAIDGLLCKHYENDFDYFKVIYLSLANKYHETLQNIESVMGRKFKKLHMIGGGTQSEFLCQLVANVTQLEVIAGPMEATAYGNLLAQKLGLKEFKDLEEGRKLILASSEFKQYHPQA